jgi:hypothetical protein
MRALPSRAGTPFLLKQVKQSVSLRKYCGHVPKTNNKPASRLYAIDGTLAGVDMQSAQTVLSDQCFGAQVQGEQDTMWLEGLLPMVALRAWRHSATN